MRRNLLSITFVWLILLPLTEATAQQRFRELVGNAQPRPVSSGTSYSIPYITWGGDIATFYANGGLSTARDSIFGQLGIEMTLTPGDDFLRQVRDYMAGRTPFLRGTYRMLAQASEVLGSDPSTKPVVIMQLSWSAGDHIVARAGIRSLNDLKQQRKVRIACQQGGPHVGLLYDSLDVVGLSRDDIEIVWVPDLTGDNGAASAFRNDDSISACCVITPDMIGLTGGVSETGTGAEGTVRGATVVNSTQQMSRSIADVYAVRADWYQTHRDYVDKFVAGYLKATTAVVDMRRDYETTQRMSNEYRKTLTMAQSIFGDDVLQVLEVDAHGLLMDCGFVGLPGQIAFFEDKGNLNGFEAKMKTALDMATGWGYARSRFGFSSAELDYTKLARIAGLKYEKPTNTGGRILDNVQLPDVDEGTIVSFDIGFDMDQTDFPVDRYGADFLRAVKAASTFGNAVVMIRGHSDITTTIKQLVGAGRKKGILTRRGSKPPYEYLLNGKRVNLGSPAVVEELINSGVFEGAGLLPAATLREAKRLSVKRAENVRESLVKFADQQGVNLDLSQIQPIGIGISQPVVPIPRSLPQAARNRRVEFRIVRVPAEALKATDFDF